MKTNFELFGQVSLTELEQIENNVRKKMSELRGCILRLENERCDQIRAEVNELMDELHRLWA